MAEGAILPMLVRMAAPNAFGFFMQAGISMMEAWYIGQLGTASLAAIALVFPGLMLMQMLSGGAMGGAVTSAIAQSLGRGNVERAQKLVWHAFAIACAGAAVFFVLNLVFGHRVLVNLGARGEVLDQASVYVDILFTGSVFIWLMALLGAVFRGMGDMKTPALMMIVGAMVQIPLSGALILGWFHAPHLGIASGAVSIILVSALNCVILLGRLAYGRVALPLRRAALALRLELFADILRVGTLASLSPIFVVLTIGVLNSVMSDFGTAAVAGYGIAARLEFLLIPLVFGLGASMTSLVGFNIGAGNVERAERIGWIGGTSAAVLTGSVGLVLAIAPGMWMSLFTHDPGTYAAGATYLRIAGPAFLFQGLGLSLYFASQGAGTVVWPVVATILRFVVAAGVAAAGVHWFHMGLWFVCARIAAGMILYGVVTAASIHFGAWRLHR
jgi:MATE family, multidrug efflux pump